MSSNSALYLENLFNNSLIEFCRSNIFFELVLIESLLCLIFLDRSICSVDFLVNSIILFSWSFDFLYRFLIKSGFILFRESITDDSVFNVCFISLYLI